MEHRGYQVSATFKKYANGQNCIKLIDKMDGFPYATATVSVEEKIEEDEVVIKDYSENVGLLDVLVKGGVVSDPIRVIRMNYVELYVCKLLSNNVVS